MAVAAGMLGRAAVAANGAPIRPMNAAGSLAKLPACSSLSAVKAWPAGWPSFWSAEEQELVDVLSPHSSAARPIVNTSLVCPSDPKTSSWTMLNSSLPRVIWPFRRPGRLDPTPGSHSPLLQPQPGRPSMSQPCRPDSAMAVAKTLRRTETR